MPVVRRPAREVPLTRSVLSLALLVGASCASRSAGSSTSGPVRIDTVTTSIAVSTIDTTQPATRDGLRRANEAAAAADTILAQPDSITLRIGEVLRPWGALQIEARSANGEQIANFAPLIRVEDHSIVEQSPDGLIARREGRTRLIISPFSPDPTVRVRDIRAVVVLYVVP